MLVLKISVWPGRGIIAKILFASLVQTTTKANMSVSGYHQCMMPNLQDMHAWETHLFSSVYSLKQRSSGCWLLWCISILSTESLRANRWWDWKFKYLFVLVVCPFSACVPWWTIPSEWCPIHAQVQERQYSLLFHFICEVSWGFDGVEVVVKLLQLTSWGENRTIMHVWNHTIG